MIIIFLLFLLLSSFLAHFVIIALYIMNRSKTLFLSFMITAVSNMAIGMVMSIMILRQPSLLSEIDLRLTLWLLSGFAVFILLFIKISVVVKIIFRRNNPENYHLNYFGKKVYNDSLIKKNEYYTFILTIPFFLMLGVYFLGGLINIYRFGHL